MRRNLRLEMLEARVAGDRAKGERIRAMQHEEIAKDAIKQHELLNSSFYRIWQDWDAHKEIQSNRMNRREGL